MPPNVPLAVFADYAVAHRDDETLTIIGGGIRSLSFVAFPATRPRLALALGLEFPPADSAQGHTLRIEARGPTNEPPVKPLTASITVSPDELHLDQPLYFQLAYNMENIRFPTEGEYTFSITVDDELIDEVRLRVLTTPRITPEVEAGALLNEGYAAFGRGDIVAAQKIFEDVVARFPAAAGGHNNLGFVFLYQSDPRVAQAALEAFARARTLGYVQPELLDANLACAHYLLGDWVAASTFFDQCLRVHGFRGSAVLFGIDGDHFFPVELYSAADYVALMMLNLGWSALRGNDRSAATRHVEGAGAADICRRENEGGKHFAIAVQSLRQELAAGPPAA